MTVFEERFLSCRPDAEAITLSSLDGLALSPGPLEAPEPLFSDDVRWIEEYPEGRFLDSLALIDGVYRDRDGPDSMWTHRWSCGGRSIAIVQIPGELLEQDGEAIWLGSKLRDELHIRGRSSALERLANPPPGDLADQ